MHKVFALICSLVLVLLMFIGCNSQPVKIESIELSDKEVHIGVGEEYELSAKVLPKEVDTEDITWLTTNDSVIRLNQNGKIKGLEDGVAIVSVKSENGVTSDSCYVYVETHKASDELNQTEYSVYCVLTDEDVLYEYLKEPNSVTIRDVQQIVLKSMEDGYDEVTDGSEYLITISATNGFGGKSTDSYLVARSQLIPAKSNDLGKYIKNYIRTKSIDDLDLTRLNKALKEYFEEKGW